MVSSRYGCVFLYSDYAGEPQNQLKLWVVFNKCWRGCGEKRTLLHYWWECKLVQSLWRTVWLLSVAQSLSHVWLFAIAWAAACQASLSFTMSQSLLKLMSIKSVMPSNHLILSHLLLLLPSVFPSIRVISNESALHIRCPKYWSFSFSISPSNEYSGLISFRIDWFEFFAVQGTLNSLLNTTVQMHQFFGA